MKDAVPLMVNHVKDCGLNLVHLVFIYNAGQYATITREMTPIKRIEQLEDVLRHIQQTKINDVCVSLNNRWIKFNRTYALQKNLFVKEGITKEECQRLYEFERDNLTQEIGPQSSKAQATTDLQFEICQLGDLQHVLKSPMSEGGTKNTLTLIESIKAKTRKINDLFTAYNKNYRINMEKWTLQSIEVSNHTDGAFWIDAANQPQDIIDNRVVIDTWCKLERILESFYLLKRDIALLLTHIDSDVDLLQREHVINSDSQRVKDGWKALILTRMASLTQLRDDICNCAAYKAVNRTIIWIKSLYINDQSCCQVSVCTALYSVTDCPEWIVTAQ